MIKNYIKIAFRNLLRHKALSVINLLGLASGFAITLLILQYVNFERSYENTHANADRIVRLTLNYLTGETVTTQDCEVYPPVGPRLAKDLSEVETYSRVYSIGEPNSPMKIGDQLYLMENLYAVDGNFFNMFDYDLIHGSTENIFLKPNEAVITESTALKYFNRTDVVGEVITSPNNGKSILYNIVGVTRDSPLNTHLKIDMLISYPTMLSDPEMVNRHGEVENNWGNNNAYMYVMLAEGANYLNFTKNLKAFNAQLIAEEKIKSEEIIGQKIADIHLYSQKTFEPETNGDANAVFFILAVAALIIISAFVNYINLTTSQALDRAKEVGVKKVLGSTKSQLRIQFLIESLVMNVLASILAVILVLLGRSTFISISGLPDGFSFITNLSFWLPLVVFILIGGLLSGLYPAFVLSSFKPSSILKGDFSHSLKGVLLRKGLVVFQFSITIILLIQTFTVNEQLTFLRGMERGINVEQSIVIEAPVENANQNYSAFKESLLANANVNAVSLTHSVPGQPVSQLSTTADIVISGTTPDKYHNFYLTFIDKDYISLLGIDLLAGTNFHDGTNADQRQVIVNEEALKRWNITDPKEAIGKKLAFWGGDWTIKGVANNYHQQSPKQPLLPMIHIYTNNFRSLAIVNFKGGSPSDNLDLVKATYASIYPGAPFSYFFMDQQYDKQFKAEDQFKRVFTVLSCFSILIACLGLLGLASFSVAKRKKEIGIRKVVGASTTTILFILSKDFLKTVLVAVIISVPITFLLIENWLENFAYKIDLNIWLFVLPVLLVFVLVLASISFKIIKTAAANPIKSLRTE